MSKKRKPYSGEIKAKVALAAIHGEETVPQLAARYGLHPTQINSWGRQLHKRPKYFQRIKANHPQTNGICEHFHKTILQGILPSGIPVQDLPVHRAVASRSG